MRFVGSPLKERVVLTEHEFRQVIAMMEPMGDSKRPTWASPGGGSC